MFDFSKEHQTPNCQSLLSIAGGGLLGVIPAAMLLRFEALGKEKYGQSYLLSKSFDHVAGSSTGAIIATAIALGLSAQDIADFYLKDVPRGFRRRRAAIPYVHDVLDAEILKHFFELRTKGNCLERSKLHCDLTIVTKDAERGTTIAFTTVKGAKRSVLGAEIRNEAHQLSDLLRASTAAPGLFRPAVIDLEDLGEVRLIDGGLSVFNNPSVLLSRMAHMSNADKINLTSLGTGQSRPVYRSKKYSQPISAIRAMRSLFTLIKDGELLAQGLMQDLAHMLGDTLDYRHFDMPLTQQGFDDLNFKVSPRELRSMRKFADFSGKPRLFAAAQKWADENIHAPLALCGHEHLAEAIDS